MKHLRHDMHVNSLFSWRMLNVPHRKARVCEMLEMAGRPLTDREVCDLLGTDDLNAARPRITVITGPPVTVIPSKGVQPQRLAMSSCRRVRVALRSTRVRSAS